MFARILIVTLMAMAATARADDPEKAKRDRDAEAALKLALELSATKPAEKARPNGDPVVVIAYGVGDRLFISDKLPVDADPKLVDAAFEKAATKATALTKAAAVNDTVPDEPLVTEDDPDDVEQFLITADVPMVCKDGVCRPLVATVPAVTAPVRKAANCTCTDCQCGASVNAGMFFHAAPLTYDEVPHRRVFKGPIRGFLGRLFGR